jgi:molecular chaperone HtpG
MSKIIIPKKIGRKLPDGSFVYRLMENAGDLLWKTPYFPEYTMHNEYHINAVLELADNLIPKNTLNKLNTQSIEILVGAIILHDLGMFIRRAGLKRLIFGKHKDRCEKYLDKLTWNEAWRDFYSKARRYTDRQLMHIFGNTTPIKKLPFDDVLEGNELLYGEFLRQNHARLAFDITQIGFPSNDVDQDVFENSGCDDEHIKALIGIVARSHEMKDLRDAEEFLRAYQCIPGDIPLYYLMAVLRMADILHIGQERAPKFTELQDKIYSPESQRQFHLNQTIVNGPSFILEQKLVEIIADPECSSTFEDVENQVRKIRDELDHCWAVLAEKYQYKYELSIHRIKSNLSDENKVAQFNNKFLTRKLTLGASPDIGKLLIEPLYGNNPSYGVRELIQNAVDACNERKIMDDTFLGKIIVSVDTERNIFEIIDNGIGMNEDVLKNYFLVVGSSYRCSDVWRENYTDDNAKAKFARIGRFGIGGLAGFLIGDEITVTTRHKDDELGFEFTYTLKPESLDVKRINADIGTKIAIKMHENASEIFHEDIKNFRTMPRKFPAWFMWYYFSTPQIDYYFNGKQITYNSFIIPNKDNDCNDWYDIPNNGFLPNIKLLFECNNHDKHFSKRLELVVNGILVNYNFGGPIFSRNYLSLDKCGFDVETPIISIEDSDNILNLDLTRTKVYNLPEKSVCEETFKYYLARLLAYPITAPIKHIASNDFYDKYFTITNNGFTICSQSFIYHTKLQKVNFLGSNNDVNFNSGFLSNTPIAIFHGQKSNVLSDIDFDLVDLKLQRMWYDVSNNNHTLFLEKERYYDCEPNVTPLPFGLTLSNELFLIAEFVPGNRQQKPLTRFKRSHSKYLPTEENLMLKVLREYLPIDVNDGFIPFEMEKRKEFYPKAFSELKRYMPN